MSTSAKIFHTRPTLPWSRLTVFLIDNLKQILQTLGQWSITIKTGCVITVQRLSWWMQTASLWTMRRFCESPYSLWACHFGSGFRVSLTFRKQKVILLHLKNPCIVDLHFRIMTCRYLLAIVFRTWGLVCSNLSFASREFVCARSTAFVQ